MLQTRISCPDKGFQAEPEEEKEEEFPSCNMEFPMDQFKMEEASAAASTICGNFDLDVDFSNVSIIPATPPRNPLPQSSHKHAGASPILSQRSRKTIKRKLALACSTSTPEGKRSRRDTQFPTFPEAPGFVMKEENPVGNPAGLLSVTQCVHWLDHSSPVPVSPIPVSAAPISPVPVSPPPSPVIRNPEPSRIFQEVNFDLEVDFLERSLSPPALSLVIQILSIQIL